jgi:mannose-1-phosphate guanylyltransferase
MVLVSEVLAHVLDFAALPAALWRPTRARRERQIEQVHAWVMSGEEMSRTQIQRRLACTEETAEAIMDYLASVESEQGKWTGVTDYWNAARERVLKPLRVQETDLSRACVVRPIGIRGSPGLWPASQADLPEVLQTFSRDDETLLAKTIARVVRLGISWDRVIVIAPQAYRSAIVSALPAGFPADQNLILEPAPQGTGLAMARSLALLEQRFGAEATAIFMPTDQVIPEQEEHFQTALRTAVKGAQNGRNWMTIAAAVKAPLTKYGYFLQSEPSKLAPNIVKAEGFIEKPDREVLETMLARENLAINAGIFVVNVGVGREAFSTYAPEIARAAEAAGSALVPDERINRLYADAAARPQSVDEAVLEAIGDQDALRLMTVPAEFPWDEENQWDLLTQPTEKGGVQIVGPAYFRSGRPTRPTRSCFRTVCRSRWKICRVTPWWRPTRFS